MLLQTGCGVVESADVVTSPLLLLLDCSQPHSKSLLGIDWGKIPLKLLHILVFLGIGFLVTIEFIAPVEFVRTRWGILVGKRRGSKYALRIMVAAHLVAAYVPVGTLLS